MQATQAAPALLSLQSWYPGICPRLLIPLLHFVQRVRKLISCISFTAHICVTRMLCQQLPQQPAVTPPREKPVGAQRVAADRQLLIFYALLIHPHVKLYPVCRWAWTAGLWQT